ncbi:site-specific integrase [Stenotrophomonas maltophilia]|uniref:tyrosine-type recombinase/integrase n=1 Tax=Stenotrophomonas maltophilia TaxID=40324 RepID=UPI0029057902|nr:site-specific integrase [Stenotrophomonas maltophilia]MCU1110815.1 site-specific integrase [Stenotrophomonas maltophilia]
MKVVFFPNGRSCWEVNAYLIHCRRLGLAVGTISTYASELSLLVRFLHLRRLELREIDDDRLIEFADWLVVRDESSARHINRILSRVLAFIGWAECISLGPSQVGLLGEQAMITVERRVVRTRRVERVASDRHVAMLPSGAKRIVRPMPLDVFRRLLAQCERSAKRSFCKSRNRAMLLILADVGIRREELVWIRVADVLDASNGDGMLKVRTSKRKGNPIRLVPVPALTLQEVMKYISVQREMQMRRHTKSGRGGRDRGWAFCSRSGSRLAPATVSQIFSDLRALAGVSERATAHMLRHRYITLQIIDRIERLRNVGILGVEAAATVLAQVASLSGHSNPTSMWDYIDWAYQEMASDAENRGAVEIVELIRELEVLGDAALEGSDGRALLNRVRSALVLQLEKSPKLGVLAHQGMGLG